MIVAPTSMVSSSSETVTSSSTEAPQTVSVTSVSSVVPQSVVVAEVKTSPTETSPVETTPVETTPVVDSDSVTIEVNGTKVVCSPKTHVFRDGKPVLKKDGFPKNKPGPRKDKASTATAAPKPKKAPKKASPKAKTPEKVETVATPVEAKEPETVASTVAPAVSSAPIKEAFTATVQRTYGALSKQEVQDETIEVKSFVVPPATIEVGYGLTLNIGNYESARVDVKINLPCYKEEADQAYEYARQWAETRVRREVAEVRALANKAPTSSF